MKKNISLKDIANKLGVSPTTVSFVLNGKGKEKKISEAVIEKIKAYSKEINYKPNSIAQSLRTGKSKILVFMVEDIGNHFFARIARIIEDLAYAKGYRVLFCSSENNDERSIELINMFNDRQVDGFIIIPSPGLKKQIENLVHNKVPVVLFDRFFEDVDVSHVVIDNHYAAFNATNHLIENGFKDIGFITTTSNQNQMLHRLRGYKDAIRDANLVPRVFEVPLKNNTYNIEKLLAKSFAAGELDAIFFSTNYLAQMGMEFIKRKDPYLFSQLGIVAFDDNQFFKILTPSITAISQPLEEIAKELVEIILNLLNAKDSNLSSRKVVLKSKLIVRNSSVKRS